MLSSFYEPSTLKSPSITIYLGQLIGEVLKYFNEILYEHFLILLEEL